MKLAYSIAATLLLVASGFRVQAETVLKREYTQTIKKEYAISPTGTTAITNKYGKVDIKTWDKNRVKISVTIVVDASNETSAQEVFDRISIDFSNSGDYVKAETSIEPRKSRWFSWANNNKSDYRINYSVYVPKTNSLELDHKYGDLYVAAVDGKVNMDVKYVNFKLEGLGDDSRVSFAYGKGAINSARDLSMTLGYGTLSMEEVMDLSVESKYSEISVGKAEDVNCASKYDSYTLGEVRDFRNSGKYDNFSIGQADNVEIQGKYTAVSAGTVNQNIDLDLEYGGADFTLANSFAECQLNGRYTDFAVTVARGSDFKLDAAATYAGIRYPRGLDVTYEKEQSSSHEIKGSMGNGSSEIVARLTYGSLKIRTQ